MRLDKYLADASLGTRSEVKVMIKKGLVLVNGEVCATADTKVGLEDEIVVAGKPISLNSGHRYYVLNKPSGYVTANKDNLNKTIMDLLPKEVAKNLSAVGRLDKDTEGMILLTDDGDFNHRLMSPKKHVSKKYFARLSVECEDRLIEDFKNGLDIGDEKLLKPAILEILDKRNEIYVTITEGRYHQVKRMFLKYGIVVEYLKRVAIGELNLPDDLKLGEWRELTESEVALFQ